MEGSVGQALRDARLQKNLTVEDVSRATKIRPPRVTDLENDDYTKFPNLAYARSFLVLYARFMGVDISKYPTLEVGSTVGLSDYQYLRGDETEQLRPMRQETGLPPEKPRWLILFFVFLVMAAIGALIAWGFMNYRRLGPVENLVNKNETGAPATPAATPTPTPEPTPVPAPSPSPTAAPAPSASPSPSAPPALQPEVRRAEPLATNNTDAAILAEAAAIAAAPAQAALTDVVPPAGMVREMQLRVTKKIKVRIVRDNPKAASLYYGFVNPAQPPLTYPGKQFWIKTADPDALKITVNGQPATGPESGVEILRMPGL